jgi:hypothetical protein
MCTFNGWNYRKFNPKLKTGKLSRVLARICTRVCDVSHLQGLDNEVGDHSSVVGVHAWPKRVENTSHANIHIALRNKFA